MTDAKAALRAQIVDYLRERSIVVRLRCTREQLVSYHSTRARESPGLCAMSNSTCLRAACYIWKQSSCSGKPSEPPAQRPAQRQRAAQACLVCLLLTPVLSVLVIVIDGPAQEPLLHALAACMNLEERSLQKNSAKLTHTGSAASPRALRSVQVRNQKSLLPTQLAPRAWGYGLLWARGGTRVPWPLSRKCSRATLTTFSAPSTSHRGGWGAGALTEGRKGVRWQLCRRHAVCCQNWARGYKCLCVALCSQPLQDLLREQACAGPPLELGLRELCALSVYTHVLRELPVLARQWLVALGAPPRDAIQHQRPHAYVCCPRCYPLLSSLSRASISYASQAVLGYRMPSPAQPSTQPQVTRRRLRRCPAEAPQVESCALVGRPRATQGSRALHIGHGHDLGIFAIIFKVPSGQVETEAVCCFS